MGNYPNTDKEKFAVMYAQEAKFWQLCHDNNWPDGLRIKYREYGGMLKTIVNNISTAFDCSISGYHDEISHYDIDKALMKQFGNKVRTDSEMGGFYASCNQKDQDDVMAWLEETYPELELSSRTSIYITNPWFANWSEAEQFCKENGFTVELPDVLNTQVLDELKLVESQVNFLNAKKESLLNSL